MTPKNKYHLLPEQSVSFPIIRSKNPDKLCFVYGMIKAYNMDYQKEPNTWVKTSLMTNEKGEFYWKEPDLIAVVKARKSFECDVCGKTHYITSRFTKVMGYKSSKNLKYVGLLDFEGCCVPEWGYSIKICLECALKTFKDAVVYQCAGWDDNSCWSTETPTIDKPQIKLYDVLLSCVEVS
jgi:hypothetical protein